MAFAAPDRSGIGQPEQERQQDVVDEQRRAAVRHERQGDAGQRHQLDHPADDDERLHTHDRRETGGQQLLEGAVGANRDPEAGADQEQVRHQDRGGTDQPHLLGDRGEDEVVLRLWHLVGGATAEPGAGDAAVADPVERLHDLETAAVLVLPRVEPDRDAGLHMIEQPPRDVGGSAEQDDAEDQVHVALGADPQHDDEQGEEQQRRPEVALADHHQHGEPPGDDERQDVPWLRQSQRADLPGGGGDQFAPVGEVGREEHRQRQLGELPRLEVDRPDAHPDARAVRGVAETGHHRQQEHAGADEEQRPLVAGQVDHALDQHEGGAEGADRDQRPERLQPGELLVEAGDHHESDAVEQEGEWEQGGVGAASQLADGEVGGGDQEQDESEERSHPGGDHRVRPERGEGVGHADDGGGHHDQGELGLSSVLDDGANAHGNSVSRRPNSTWRAVGSRGRPPMT